MDIKSLAESVRADFIREYEVAKVKYEVEGWEDASKYAEPMTPDHIAPKPAKLTVPKIRVHIEADYASMGWRVVVSYGDCTFNELIPAPMGVVDKGRDAEMLETCVKRLSSMASELYFKRLVEATVNVESEVMRELSKQIHSSKGSGRAITVSSDGKPYLSDGTPF